MNPTLGLKREPSMIVIQSAVMSSTCIYCAGQVEETYRNWRFWDKEKVAL